MPVLKVAYDMTFGHRNQGGSGVYARSLVAALRNCEDVDVCEITGPTRSDLPRTLRWLTSGARSAVNACGAEVVHCPSFVAPWRLPAPYVLTVHDAGARLFPGDHPLEWRVYDRAFMVGRLKSAIRVITGSNFSRDEIVSVYGVKPERVVAIHYGIDPRYFKARKEPAGEARAPMLFPGAPVKRKNIGAVLRCMAGALEGTALHGAELNISGARRKDFPEVTALIESLALTPRVHWLGVVPSGEMPTLVAGSSLVVYPSLSEGFGFPVLEALAVGTPVVCSNRGSLPEVVDSAALIVNPSDGNAIAAALESVLTQPQLRLQLAAAGRERARAFTWERCAEETVSVYRVAASEARQRG